jgi:hypothetical protein
VKKSEIKAGVRYYGRGGTATRLVTNMAACWDDAIAPKGVLLVTYRHRAIGVRRITTLTKFAKWAAGAHINTDNQIL